jgi:hypothetical protein
MNIHMSVCAYLERNSQNGYRREKCFEQTFQRKIIHILCVLRRLTKIIFKRHHLITRGPKD